MHQTAERLVRWIGEQVRTAGARGTVLGISGGIDSSVAAVLCKKAFPDTTLGLIMPCHSLPEDAEHAQLLAAQHQIETRLVPLDRPYDELLLVLRGCAGPEAGTAEINLKPRLRMAALYYHACRLNYLVVGSSNRCELAVGYFTKWGDSGVDIMPLGNLLKSEVVALAAALGIPEQIVQKPPSAGLWPGQTDEGEMGITYAQIEDYLGGRELDAQVRKKIESRIALNAHKRSLAPVPPVW